jgi:hypothetical protein
MQTGDVIMEHIDRLVSEDCIYTQNITGVFNVEITGENLSDLEVLINFLEIHEESLKQIRRKLQLKQQSYLMKYMGAYARALCE